MAEAIAVVSIVSNIVQLVDFGSKVLCRLNEYQSSLGDIPESYQHIKAELPVLLDTLQQTQKEIESGSIRDETKQALLPAIEGCQVQVKLLSDVILKVLPEQGDSWGRRKRKAFSSLHYDGKVEKITTIIRKYIQTLTYYHAAVSSTLKSIPGRPEPSSTVPFRRDPDFVDRKVLGELHRKCPQPASRVALVGLGGVGKSQLVIEYSYQAQEEFPKTWVFWVHAGSPARFVEGYRKIAEVAKLPGWDEPKADVLRITYTWLCDKASGRWLMIVDNADDSNVLFRPLDEINSGVKASPQAANSLADLLPQSSHGSILITSRNQDLAYRLTGRHLDIIKVKPMGSDEALHLLRKRLPNDLMSGDAVELLEMLDYMPLAISQAAAYISQRAPRVTISKYLRHLRQGDKDRADLLNKDVGDTRRDTGASNSIISTWQISFEHIRKNMPTAARLLSLMCLFDRQGIPESLVRHNYHEDGDTEPKFEEDLYTLASYSLIGMNSKGEEFEMHRLVQLSTKKWLELYNELEYWKEKYVKLLDDAYPAIDYKNWKASQALFPHAAAALDYRPMRKHYVGHWSVVMIKASWYTAQIGRHEEAEKMSRRLLEGVEIALGSEAVVTLDSVIWLAAVLNGQTKLEEAEKLMLETVEKSKRVLGLEHWTTLEAMRQLAWTLGGQGRWNEAEEPGLQVLETTKRVFGEEAEWTLDSMSTLASMYYGQGKFEKAKDLQDLVVETYAKTLGEDDRKTLTEMGHLALILKEQDQLAEAISLMDKYHQFWKQKLGGDHPETAKCLDLLQEWREEYSQVHSKSDKTVNE
ncbi:hypothetical protein AOQ84DRAFT_388390 [Glonium stellatum]|uniref:NACHT-NTPase and P-loop NTPases N-terminal domain-containing protein n=1 Tax=Glonium stellatum TaxID=574774 RepID=A0A8E2JTM2_9PEZI|nr:hypothetical protein AOQ84DRAFT_388390 [Glonium stellatum]